MNPGRGTTFDTMMYEEKQTSRLIQDTLRALDIPFRAGIAETGVLETIKRDARNLRRLHHPHVARIHDVYDDEGLLLVSVDPHDGELLSTVLARNGAMPYRELIVKMVEEYLESVERLNGLQPE